MPDPPVCGIYKERKISSGSVSRASVMVILNNSNTPQHLVLPVPAGTRFVDLLNGGSVDLGPGKGVRVPARWACILRQ